MSRRLTATAGTARTAGRGATQSSERMPCQRGLRQVDQLPVVDGRPFRTACSPHGFPQFLPVLVLGRENRSSVLGTGTRPERVKGEILRLLAGRVLPMRVATRGSDGVRARLEFLCQLT